MSRRKIKAGSTSNVVPIFVQDTSKTDGSGLGSLVYNTSGLSAKYRRSGDASWTTITLATATAGTWASGGFVADGGPITGGYELGLPDAACAASATWVEIAIYGVANMLPVLIEIELDAVNYQDATRFGLAALPNASAGASGGLPLSVDTSGRVDVLKINGTSQTARDIGASVLLSSGTGTGQLDFTSGVVKANTTQVLGGTIPTPNTTGVPLVDTKYVSGTLQTAGDLYSYLTTNLGALGHGASVVTITVNDGTTVIQNARVTMVINSSVYTAVTNASGVATLSPNEGDGTYSIRLTATGYQFTPTTLAVSGDTSHTYSMTSNSVSPPANPSLSAIEVLCVDSSGDPEDGVAVDIRMISIPSGSQNIAFRGSKQTAVSDANGIARFEVVQSGTYEWKRGLADVWQEVVIDADGVTNVTSVIGSP